MGIKQIIYSGLEPGRTLTVLGSVHGNEKCGTEAINKIIEKIESGEIKIKKGKVVFVPIANPKAYENNTRFFERNLNRELYPKLEPEHYEDKVGTVLCDILSNTDVLLDLHSYASKGGPFCFLGLSSEQELNYCKSLGISDFVYGYLDAYSTADAKKKAMGTTEYTRTKGGIATTIECGHHFNLDNIDIGVEVILRAFKYLDLSDIEYDFKYTSLDRNNYKYARIEEVCIKEKEGKFIQNWQHYDRVEDGECIAVYEDGERVYTNQSGFLILPKESATVGTEWFYIATPQHL